MLIHWNWTLHIKLDNILRTLWSDSMFFLLRPIMGQRITTQKNNWQCSSCCESCYSVGGSLTFEILSETQPAVVAFVSASSTCQGPHTVPTVTPLTASWYNVCKSTKASISIPFKYCLPYLIACEGMKSICRRLKKKPKIQSTLKFTVVDFTWLRRSAKNMSLHLYTLSIFFCDVFA